MIYTETHIIYKRKRLNGSINITHVNETIQNYNVFLLKFFLISLFIVKKGEGLGWVAKGVTERHLLR